MARSKRSRTGATRRPVKQASTFGAALATLAVTAPSAHAAIVSLTADPATWGFSSSIGNTGQVQLKDGGNAVATFVAWNYATFTRWITFSSSYTSYWAGGKHLGGNVGFRGTNSNPITTGQSFFSMNRSPYQAGTQVLGFLTPSNQVGWIRVDWGGLLGDMKFLEAAYNNVPGGTINHGELTGTDAVPEPAAAALTALGLLALGARGVRRYREQRKQPADSAASQGNDATCSSPNG